MKRKKQGYMARLDESLGERHRGPHQESLADRRHESEGMEKHFGKGAFAGDKNMHEGYKNHMSHAHHKFMAHHFRKQAHKK